MKIDQILLITLLVSVSLEAVPQRKRSGAQPQTTGGARQTCEGGVPCESPVNPEVTASSEQALIAQGYQKGGGLVKDGIKQDVWVKDGIMYRIGEGGALYEAVG